MVHTRNPKLPHTPHFKVLLINFGELKLSIFSRNVFGLSQKRKEDVQLVYVEYNYNLEVQVVHYRSFS